MSIQEYEQALQGKIILPTDKLYVEKCHIFNSAIQSKPAAIIVCGTDVFALDLMTTRMRKRCSLRHNAV